MFLIIKKQLLKEKKYDILTIMKETFFKYGINLTQKQADDFNEYYRILTEYNQKFNITAITEREQVILKNFIDSVIFNNLVKGKIQIDIGSGGGFPALPLKILNPERHVTLLEATGKKCEFLKAVSESLGLSEVNVINGRAEDYAVKPEYREKFDIATARAVARLNILTEYCLPFVKVGGIFVGYKAQAEEEIKEAENSINLLGGKIKEIKTVKIADFTRTAVVIQKIKSTDKKYPRSNAQIRKNPL